MFNIQNKPLSILILFAPLKDLYTLSSKPYNYKVGIRVRKVRLSVVALVFFLLVLAPVFANFSEVNKITASDAQADDQFGWSVSISGDDAIVGAYNEDAGGSGAGAAYIFKKNATGQYEQVNKITASDAQADDQFGWSVSISGDDAIVGAYWEDPGGISKAGAAYIFKKNASAEYEQVNKITASDAQINDRFGVSVSISGDYAVIGAYGEATGGTNAGAAYIFKKNASGEYEQVNKIMASDAQAGDLFGESVSISGDYALVGAYQEDGGGGVDNNTGAAYIFKKNATGQYEQVNKIMASDAQVGDLFGYSVSISGDYAVIGAYGESSAGANTGAAYIFKKNASGEYEQVNKITASDAQATDYFGMSVSISGDYAVAGAPAEDSGGISNAGASYIFKKNAGTGEYEQTQKITASDAQIDDVFGRSVSISGDYALVGADWEDPGGISKAGAAYVFYNTTPPYPNCPDTDGNWTPTSSYNLSQDITCDQIVLGAASHLTIKGGYTITANKIESSTGAQLTIEGDATLDTTNTDLTGTTVSIDNGQTLKIEYSGTLSDTNTCYSSGGTYNLNIENKNTGSIQWTGGISAQVCNLSDDITISSNYTYVNSTKEPNMNTSATITLAGLPFSGGAGDITIMRDINGDGTYTACPGGVCTVVSYLGGVATFTVTQFSGYSVSGAIATTHSQSHWVNTEPAGSIITEGGNVSNVTVETNESTQKWAGSYGNVNATLILAENATSVYMYNWTWNASSGGEVCVTQNTSPNWATIAPTTAAAIDTIWGFTPTDGDSAANTYTNSFATFTLSGVTITTAGTNHMGSSSFQSGAMNLTSGSVTQESEVAFCTNMSSTGTNYRNLPVNYEVIYATTAASGPGPIETYYFFVELSAG